MLVICKLVLADISYLLVCLLPSFSFISSHLFFPLSTSPLLPFSMLSTPLFVSPQFCHLIFTILHLSLFLNTSTPFYHLLSLFLHLNLLQVPNLLRCRHFSILLYTLLSFFLSNLFPFFCSGQAIVVGMGKKNPNAQKGRERRGKSKKQA